MLHHLIVHLVGQRYSVGFYCVSNFIGLVLPLEIGYQVYWIWVLPPNCNHGKHIATFLKSSNNNLRHFDVVKASVYCILSHAER